MLGVFPRAAMSLERRAGNRNRVVVDVNRETGAPTDKGRYWIRLADTREKSDSRKSRTGQRRSRLQASVSWAAAMIR